MEKQQVLNDVPKLINWLKPRETKYRVNYNRYMNNGSRTEEVSELYGLPNSALYVRADDSYIPALNIIRSVIDSHISKLSQAEPRPFFNPIQGNYKTRKVCRNAQVFFDEYFERFGLYKKAIEAARDAEIFEYGALFVDDEDMQVYKINPWEFYFDPAEMNYGKLSRCMIVRKNYPLNALKDKIKRSEKVRSLLERDPFGKCEYTIYYNLIEKEKHILIGADWILKEKIDYDTCPVVQLYYTPPVKGGYSTSIVDNLYQIQLQVDSITHKISVATALTPANTIFVPKGSGVKASVLSNEIGAVYEYQPIPGITSPVEVSTPRAIDPQYTQLLEFWIAKAYNQEGVSELSAQSKKPTGINSGVALQTLENVESERHNVILKNYITFLMNLTKTIIAIFPEKEDVLPKNSNRANVKWADIKKSKDLYTIQFSATTSLSKDPQTKLEQIEKLQSMGIINPSMIASLLELPDLEQAYSITTASYDNCQKIIDRAIETGDYQFYEIVNLDQLYSEVCNTLLRLDANDEDEKVLNRLVELLKIVKQKKDMVNETMAPPPPPPAPPMDPNMVPPVDPNMMPPQPMPMPPNGVPLS